VRRYANLDQRQSFRKVIHGLAEEAISERSIERSTWRKG
jgi:hypothetical protein